MNCAYSDTLEAFLAEDPARIIAALHEAASQDGFSRQWSTQTAAWNAEIQSLRETIGALIDAHPAAARGLLCLEYEIARRGRRIDVIVILNDTVVVIEFKTSPNALDGSAQRQVREYSYDLRDFHSASANIPIIPILVAVADPPSQPVPALPEISFDAPGVREVISCSSKELVQILQAISQTADAGHDRLDPAAWRDAPYKPSLNIIEAAERIFAGQQVREISHAAAENLTATVDAVIETITHARQQSRRVVCLLTGVPGAGKTLAGLSAVHDPALRVDERAAAVFLSGNGPLVRIVRAALVRDLRRRGRQTADSQRQVSTFIQNVHAFLGHYAIKAPGDVPAEHVVVFDEAQRAWSGDQMQRKKRGTLSEAELMLQVMERLEDWAVIVALVGFGQEIHQGEAGLLEWGRALSGRTKVWSVVASPVVLEDHKRQYATQLFENMMPPSLEIRVEPRLHLTTNIRSLRATMVSDWVEAVLHGVSGAARSLFRESESFPIRYTRDLDLARRWLRAQCGDAPHAGNCGLVTSSGGLRLRAYGLEVSSGSDTVSHMKNGFLPAPTTSVRPKCSKWRPPNSNVRAWSSIGLA
jgi:hypothetical protein